MTNTPEISMACGEETIDGLAAGLPVTRHPANCRVPVNADVSNIVRHFLASPVFGSIIDELA